MTMATVQNFIKKYNIKEEGGKYYYNGDLFLGGKQKIQLPDNLTISGWLWFDFYAPIIQLPKNLTVGGMINLGDHTQITQLSENLIVGEGLYIHGTQITQLPDNLIVGGNLSIATTQIAQLPDNLTVGGKLNLYNTRITQLPDNLTVGGDLCLSDMITQLPNNLIVGGDIYPKEQLTNPDNYKKLPRNHIFTWQNGKYIKLDGIFFEFIKKESEMYIVRHIGHKDLTYVVTDGILYS